MHEHLSLSTSVILKPLRHGLRAGQDNTVNVLVRIQAPAAPAGHGAARPPQALALVLDRSGSMAGRPLYEARRCAAYVLSKLRPTDAFSLVQFDNRVQRLWPAVPLGDGAALRTALADVAGAGLKRVILLSDGQANEGQTDPPLSRRSFREFAFPTRILEQSAARHSRLPLFDKSRGCLHRLGAALHLGKRRPRDMDPGEVTAFLSLLSAVPWCGALGPGAAGVRARCGSASAPLLLRAPPSL